MRIGTALLWIRLERVRHPFVFEYMLYLYVSRDRRKNSKKYKFWGHPLSSPAQLLIYGRIQREIHKFYYILWFWPRNKYLFHSPCVKFKICFFMVSNFRSILHVCCFGAGDFQFENQTENPYVEYLFQYKLRTVNSLSLRQFTRLEIKIKCTISIEWRHLS